MSQGGAESTRLRGVPSGAGTRIPGLIMGNMDARESGIMRTGMTTPYRFGPIPAPGGGTIFQLWAPDKREARLLLDNADYAMQRAADGFFSYHHPTAGPGSRYAFRVDGEGPYPDPASRWQPDDVHGFSAVTAPSHCASELQIEARELVLYEIHVGTFTPEGTYAAATLKIPYLKALGVTAVELMPLADFPGRRNWGYDATFLFAPESTYGTPEELRAFVRACHAAGLGVILDVVYNHFGPEGNYLWPLCRRFFTTGAATPWGDGINLGEPMVSLFFEENVRYWLREFCFDGLRLDAVHALASDQRKTLLGQLARAARQAVPGQRPFLMLENRDNQADLLGASESDYDAQWNDDFRYAVQGLLLREQAGVYADFQPAAEKMERILREGFAFQGEYAAYYGRHRGTASAGLPFTRFVNFIQSHDVPGNRACGERLDQLMPLDLYRALAMFYLLLPTIPMLFMGEEFGATSPFLFFTDQPPALGAQIKAGRMEMIRRRVAATADALDEALIPDPQAESTFLRSKLSWSDCTPDSETLKLYQAVLALRKPMMRALHRTPNSCEIKRRDQLFMIHMRGDATAYLLAANFSGQPQALPSVYGGDDWRLLHASRAGVDAGRIPGCTTALWGPVISVR